MIYTLTLNPAVDMHATAPHLLVDVTTRTEEASLNPNGKGINVALVLRHFGCDASILGFFGGFTGRYIVDECNRAGAKTVPVWVEGDTRVNLFLATKEGDYKVVNAGPTVTHDDEEALLRLLSGLEDMELLTINGSTARGCSPDLYDRIIRIAREKGAEVVLDISTPDLKALLRHRPLLIKPNDEELKSIFGLEISDERSVKDALRRLHDMGAQNILLTMGADGSYFYDGRDFYRCGTHPVKVVNSWCTGDGCLAAFLSRWLPDRENVLDALRLSSATGANIAESVGIGTLENVSRYETQIKATKI